MIRTKANHNKNQRNRTQTMNNNTKKKKKWATFTYNGKETKQITKLFKDTNIKIAYKTRNTIQKLTKKQHTQSDKYDNM
jgi:hypothetical protein